jgi:hypothetical protein
MPDFDAEGFVAAVERLGLLLTAVRFPDGNVRLYRWRMPDAVIHAQRIEALWAAWIGENPDRHRSQTASSLKKWGKMSGADIAKYLKWGPPSPLLKFVDGSIGPEGAVVGFPETIRITIDLVEMFEHKESFSRSNVTSINGVTTYARYPVY